MNDPKDDTFEKILAAIRRDPKDQLSRNALIDYLQELGEHDLAKWWAGGAEAWLRDFASRCKYEYDDPPYKVGDSLTYEEVLKEAEDWIAAGFRPHFFDDFFEVDALPEPNAVWTEPYRFSQYQLTTGNVALDDPDTSAKFWSALEVVWGKKIPDEAKQCGGRIFNCGSCGI